MKHVKNPNRVAAGKRAAEKLLSANPDFYSNMGKVGGKASTTGGFASMEKELHQRASSKGGILSGKSKRKKKSTIKVLIEYGE